MKLPSDGSFRMTVEMKVQLDRSEVAHICGVQTNSFFYSVKLQARNSRIGKMSESKEKSIVGAYRFLIRFSKFLRFEITALKATEIEKRSQIS